MVIPISNSGAAKIDAQRISTAPIILVEDKRDRKVEGNGTPAARFARLGPPIDVNRVNEIRAAIAGGSYTVDADRLAAAMLALDLPENAK
jgi:anti-sigma28 factor (negative regulator of flagellin synthesis)